MKGDQHEVGRLALPCSKQPLSGTSMKRGVLIVSPEFPPMRGGVADHTLALAAELAARLSAVVLTNSGINPGPAGFPIQAQVRDWHNVADLVALIEKLAPDHALLWQYVPHMYGRGGVNLALPAVMRKLQARGRRQLVIAHEIAAPLSAWPQRLYYALAQRWQWRGILEAADAVGISTEAWLEEWSHRRPDCRKNFFLAPSPATIPVVPVEQDHRKHWRAQQGLPVDLPLLGYFGTLGSGRLADWLVKAWRQAQQPGAPVGFVCLGATPEFQPDAALQPLFRPLGYLPADAVSRALQAVDVLLLPFSDGVSERRTSFMAGLSHGLPIVTTTAQNTGPTLRRSDYFLAATESEPDAFATHAAHLLRQEKERGQLGQRAREVYRKSYSWDCLGQLLQQHVLGEHAGL
jgi:glycosyltransferase involved in cell wall biosynthesis